MCSSDLARRYVEERHALLLAALFAFGTSAYSTAGRGLWQHGPCMLLLLIAFYLLEDPKLAARAGLPLALAYTTRPTAFVAVVVFTLYVARKHRTRFVAFLAWAAPVALGFLVLNRAMFGSWLAPYFQPGAQGYGPRDVGAFLEALAGNMIDRKSTRLNSSH